MIARQPQMLQMPVVETGQMSALATADMSGQRRVVILYICLVSTADICPVSAADICLVSTAGICLVAAADIGPVSTADMSSAARADICVVSTHNVDVSEVSIVAMSQCSSRR